MKLHVPEKKIASPKSYSLKFVIDSFFWEKMQDKKKYEIKSTDNNHSNIFYNSNEPNDNSINSILNDIKYIKGSRNGLR